MPITKRNGRYYWGSKGPFDSRKKAAEVAQAAHASGYEVAGVASAVGPALGRAAMAGGRTMAADKLRGGGGGGDEAEGLDEQDAHAQTEWENIHNSKSIQKLMSFVQKEESEEEPEEEDVDEDLADRMKGDEQTYYPEEAVRFPEIPTAYIDVADDPEHWRHSSPHARPKRVNIVDEGSHPSWETTPSILPEARAGIEAFPEVSGEPHSDIPGKWPTLTVPSKQAYERDEGPATPRSYKPRGGPEYMGRGNVKNSIQKLMGFVQIQEKFMRKEGAVGGEGGGFDGLSDTVFTSTNAGIFTPTYGGKGTKKKYNRNHKRQDAKRRKLMGKEKKSGVERLVQYLYDGSPHISKAGKMGLAPGLDDSMTGDGATAHAGKNRVHSPMRLNWKKNVQDDALNHKKTSREIEDAIEVAKENEPHISMGQPGGFETGTLSTYPQHSSVNAVGNAKVQPGPNWGKYNSYVQKAVNGVSTMISPTENKSADGPHPQQAFIERGTENPNEAPAKDAVLKENDMQRRVKKYDEKEEDTGHEQPAGVMAAAGMGGYPSGATMQMSSFGMNTYEQDSLARGGEEDESHDEEDIDEEDVDEPQRREDEEGNIWIPMNPDRTKSLESMRKALEDAGDEAPLLTALHKLDYS